MSLRLYNEHIMRNSKGRCLPRSSLEMKVPHTQLVIILSISDIKVASMTLWSFYMTPLVGSTITTTKGIMIKIAREKNFHQLLQQKEVNVPYPMRIKVLTKNSIINCVKTYSKSTNNHLNNNRKPQIWKRKKNQKQLQQTTIGVTNLLGCQNWVSIQLRAKPYLHHHYWIQNWTTTMMRWVGFVGSHS